MKIIFIAYVELARCIVALLILIHHIAAQLEAKYLAKCVNSNQKTEAGFCVHTSVFSLRSHKKYFLSKRQKEKMDRQNDRTADRQEGVKRAGSEDIILKQSRLN